MFNVVVTLDFFCFVLQFLAVQHLSVPVNKKTNLVRKPSDNGEDDDQAHPQHETTVDSLCLF